MVPATSRAKPPWPAAVGEMAHRLRAHDWAATPLGPMEAWPQSLRTAIDICLGSAFASFVWWGQDLIQIYNDAALSILRARHPDGFGAPAREAWSDIWEQTGTLIEGVLETGAPVFREDMAIALTRGQSPEDACFTISYSALRDESGAIAGLFITSIETTAKVKTEATLRRSEEDLRMITDAVPVQIGYVDRDQRYRFVNAEFGRFFGVPPERLLGRTLREWVGERVYERLRPYVKRALAGEAVTFEDREPDKHGPGRHSWTEENYIPRLAPDGSVEGFFLLNLDITERKRNEAALREGEEILRHIMDNVPALIGYHDREQRYCLVNKAFETFFNMPKEQLLGRTIREQVGETTYARLRPFIEQALAGETVSFDDMEPDKHGPGRHSWTEENYIPRFAPDGSVMGFYVLALDVTARKRAEERLRTSEARFREFAEASPVIVWIRDVDNLRWEYLSPAYEVVYGESRDYALTRSTIKAWAEQILPEDREYALEDIRRVRSGERVTFEYRIKRPDGRVRWIRDTDFPLLDEHGRVHRIGGIGQDITEQKQFEGMLRESESHARLLLAELQHRVRNTLGVIRSIARRTAATSETVEDYAMHLEGRIDAFARVQSAVTRDPAVGLSLEMLVADELRAVAAHEGDQVKSIAGPKIRLKDKAAETVALTIHELATNAVKYGALSTRQGRVQVNWRIEEIDGEPHLALDWIESGVRLPGQEPRRRGFGTELIERTLAYELGGEALLRFEPTGLHCTISLPLDGQLLVTEQALTG